MSGLVLKQKILTLRLKGEYFFDIKSGSKIFEYRLYNDYWRKRIAGKQFDKVLLTHGYPDKTDVTKQIFKPWRGYELMQITHPHFGNLPVFVFAIRVN